MNKKRTVLLVLWTTSRCNLNCKYCYADSSESKMDMLFETATKAIDYFQDCFMKIQFAGGEPLLNYDLICKVYDYVQKKGYDVRFQMQTNGTLIDADKAKGIKEMKIAIGISLDGAPEINEFLRGGTKRTLQGIQYLAQAGVKVNLNSVVTSLNVSRLYQIADLAVYLGNVGGIGLDLVRMTGKAKKNQSMIIPPAPMELEKGLEALFQRCQFLFENSGKKVVVREIEEAKRRLKYPGHSKNYCYASCGNSYVILPEGDVYPCGSLIEKTYYMGNVRQGKINQLSLPKTTELECATCQYLDFCPGGCPSRLIVNEKHERILDCVLKKKAFEIAADFNEKGRFDDF